MENPGPGVIDFVLLHELTEDALFANLVGRYNSDCIYVSILKTTFVLGFLFYFFKLTNVYFVWLMF